MAGAPSLAGRSPQAGPGMSAQHEPHNHAASDPTADEDPLLVARRRVDALQAEAHRIRAELARIEARREDRIADGLEGRVSSDANPSVASPPQFQNRPATPPEAAHRPTPRLLRIDAGDEAHPLAETPERHPLPGTPQRPLLPAPSLAVEAKRTLRAKRKKRGPALQRSPLAISSSLHAVLIALMGMGSYTVIQNPPPVFLGELLEGEGSLEDFRMLEELEEIETAPIDQQELELPTPTELPTDLQELSELESSETVSEVASPFEAPGPGAAGELEGLGSLEMLSAVELQPSGAALGGGGTGGGLGGGGTGSGRGARVGRTSFFGRGAAAQQVVFVVDNSASMVEGRMETALFELSKSIGALDSRQSFYVLFYADRAIPMFHPNPTQSLVPATLENKARLLQWLETTQIGPGNFQSQIEALEIAARLRPQVIYMLTDGDIRSSRAREYLLQPGRFGAPLHVFGMTVETAEQHALLVSIAQAQQGQYQPVAINPQAAQRARARPLPRYREPGGWGGAPAPR